MRKNRRRLVRNDQIEENKKVDSESDYQPENDSDDEPQPVIVNKRVQKQQRKNNDLADELVTIHLLQGSTEVRRSILTSKKGSKLEKMFRN